MLNNNNKNKHKGINYIMHICFFLFKSLSKFINIKIILLFLTQIYQFSG